MVARQSHINVLERARTMPVTKVTADVKVAHNYSAQTLNSTDLAKEKLRQQLARVIIFSLHNSPHTYFHLTYNSNSILIIQSHNLSTMSLIFPR